MGRNRNRNTRLVYSTEGANTCPTCGQELRKCRCTDTAAPSAGSSDGIVRLHRETKGRGGKAVTLIKGLPLAESELKTLAKALKQKCGVGGALRGDVIEIQGDQRTILKPELEQRGYVVKIAGG